jgi:multicomponent Na+:H+ antiporter subunit D
MLIRIFGVGTTLLGVFYAMFEKDTKRMLAFHTVSQLGFILAAPEVGGFYALTHGLVKSSLFLSAGNLPSRSFKDLQQITIKTSVWVPLVIASLSISGFPLLAGFGSKVWSMKNLLPWQAIAMNVAAVGTAISFAKFIFLPHGDDLGASKPTKSGYWYATSLLIGGLVFANFAYLQAYTIDNLIKALGTIAIGWLIYWVGIRHVTVKLPRVLEEFEHLVGMMSVVLILLFWMVLA